MNSEELFVFRAWCSVRLWQVITELTHLQNLQLELCANIR